MNDLRLDEDEARALGRLPLPVDLSRVRLHRGRGGWGCGGCGPWCSGAPAAGASPWGTMSSAGRLLRLPPGAGARGDPLRSVSGLGCLPLLRPGDCRPGPRAAPPSRSWDKPLRVRSRCGEAVRPVWDGAAGTNRGGLVSGLRPGPPAGHGGGSRSSQRANTFPSGSAISAMMPQACWVGSLRKRTPRWRSRPQ